VPDPSHKNAVLYTSTSPPFGVNCIWLLPFYPRPRFGRGYDVTEYYNVAPECRAGIGSPVISWNSAIRGAQRAGLSFLFSGDDTRSEPGRTSIWCLDFSRPPVPYG
jgi:hypothetical protein